MDSAADKLIPAMIDPGMLAIAHIHQPIKSAPPFEVNHTFQRDLAANNRLQRGVTTLWDDFGLDLTIALEDAKNDRFPIRPATSFSFNATRPKVGFINFNLAAERRLGFTEFTDTLAKSSGISIDRVAINPVRRAICAAVKSQTIYRTSWRNCHIEIRARFA